MKSYSIFEKEILSYMKQYWDKDGYSTVKKVIENKLPDIVFEISGQYGTSIATPSVDDKDLESKASLDKHNRLKLAEKLGKLLSIIDLITGLVKDNLVLMDQNLNAPSEPFTINTLKNAVDTSNKMKLFGNYADFFRGYYYSRRYPTQDILDFIENGFKSKDDIERKNSDKRFIKQFVISIVALAFSIFIGVSSLVLNIINLRSSKKTDNSKIIHKVQLMNCNTAFSVAEQDSVIHGKSSPITETRK